MTEKQKIISQKLDEQLNKDYILTHPYSKLSYIAGYIAIEQANRIFGYFGWGYELIRRPELVKEADKKGNPVWAYICSVESWVRNPENSKQKVKREDVGFADVTFTKADGKPQLEVAYKSCVTDALKRALRAWGNQFGNSLYDREDRLTTTQASKLSTLDETQLAVHVQKILKAKTTKELKAVMAGLVEIAKQDAWKKSWIQYIKTMSERRRGAIELVESRKKAEKEAKNG